MENFDSQRIKALREAVFTARISYEEFHYFFNKQYVESYWQENSRVRYADALYYAYDHATISIDENELIVGKTAGRFLTPEEAEEMQKLQYAIHGRSCSPGQDSHMTIDYNLLLQKGISGILEDIAQKRASLDLLVAENIEKDTFYTSCTRCLEAVIRFSNRYAAYAEQLAEQCDNPHRKQELYTIAAVCRNVPENPAHTFHEAIQSVHFLTFCLSIKPLKAGSMLQYQLGRPDRYLAPYYESDLQQGRITPYQAQTLLDCLAILINRRVPHGLSSGYMVGGRDANGKVVSNAVTHMALRVIEQIRLVYPSVGLCWCSDTPKEDLSLACDILKQGCSHPAFFNDDIITKGLRYYGLPAEEACNYIHSTCVEITPIGSSNVWVASPYTNLPQMLLDVLNQEYSCMDALLSAFFAHLHDGIQANFIHQTRLRAERAHTIDPLLSCFVNDCLANATDIEAGGARYNWIMPSFVGVANVADSLTVIRTLVFEQHHFTFSQVSEMLHCNYDGFEAQRQLFSNHIAKYGNDNDDADLYVKTISEWIANECGAYTPLFSNAKLVPSLFCWVMHDIFGQSTGALPDGRKAGFPLGDGSGPAQGREQNGPTASILSSTKWEHYKFIGGIAVNMKFSKKTFQAESIQKLITLVETFLERGGFEFQINITDAELLKKAQLNPEQYQDLVVRIGGYSDYFVHLSPTMQAEVMERTEHCI